MQTGKHVCFDQWQKIFCLSWSSEYFLPRCVSNATAIRCICRSGTEGQFCEKNISCKWDDWNCDWMIFSLSLDFLAHCNVNDPCLNDGGWVIWMKKKTNCCTSENLDAIIMESDMSVLVSLHLPDQDVKLIWTVILKKKLPTWFDDYVLLVINACTSNPNYCRNGGR